MENNGSKGFIYNMNYQRQDEFIRKKYKLKYSCTEADPEFSQIKINTSNRSIQSMLQQIFAATEFHSLALDLFGLNISFMCWSIFFLQKHTIHLVFRKYLRTSRWLVQSYGIKSSESFPLLFMYSSHKLHEMNKNRDATSVHLHAGSLKLFQLTWVTCSISSPTTKIYQICWSRGNALDLYLGGAWFKSWLGHYLFCFSCLSSIPPGKCRGSTSIRAQPLPSESFQNDYSSVILPTPIWHIYKFLHSSITATWMIM